MGTERGKGGKSVGMSGEKGDETYNDGVGPFFREVQLFEFLLLKAIMINKVTRIEIR